ncbi:MAG TPA: hypothetical protein DIV38_02405 [Clostridiales bacterium]|nr:hypothetical protein [Clostridiales bacterium]
MANNTVKKRTRAAKGDMLFYVLMMAWPILQFCVFYIAVKFNSILYSFQRYDKLSRTFTWTLDYVKSALKMMTTSPALVETMKMTLLFFLLFTGINTPLGLLFSYYISKKQFASGFFRVFLFLPSIICSVIMVLIYGNFVDVALPEIVRVLTGKTVSGLMSTKSTRFFAVMFYNLLVGFGVNVLMYSNAMSAISEEVVEAAHLDGATGLKEFWFITLPSIYPTLVTFLITALAGMFLNQYNLYSFFGSGEHFGLQTYGLYFYVQTLAADGSRAEYSQISAIGLWLTFIALPLTYGVKFLLEKLGPSED